LRAIAGKGRAKKTSREFELGYGSDRVGGMIGDEDGMLKKNRKCGERDH
jgi:hypothetical protein